MQILGAVALLLFVGWIIPSPLSWLTRRALEKRHAAELAKSDAETKQLRGHLHTQMEVDAEGLAGLKAQNQKLKQVNENLRVTVQTLGSKPEQAELRLLHVYDRALRIMERKFPVFVPTWRTILKHAELEMQQADAGTSPLVKKVFSPRKLVDDATPNQKLLGAQDLNGRDVK